MDARLYAEALLANRPPLHAPHALGALCIKYEGDCCGRGQWLPRAAWEQHGWMGLLCVVSWLPFSLVCFCQHGAFPWPPAPCGGGNAPRGRAWDEAQRGGMRALLAEAAALVKAAQEDPPKGEHLDPPQAGAAGSHPLAPLIRQCLASDAALATQWTARANQLLSQYNMSVRAFSFIQKDGDTGASASVVLQVYEGRAQSGAYSPPSPLALALAQRGVAAGSYGERKG